MINYSLGNPLGEVSAWCGVPLPNQSKTREVQILLPRHNYALVGKVVA